MPNLASAEKELRKNEKRRTENRAWKTRMKRLIKRVRGLTAEGQRDEATKLLPELYKTVDKMAKKNRIARNKAARIKSRVTRTARAQRES